MDLDQCKQIGCCSHANYQQCMCCILGGAQWPPEEEGTSVLLPLGCIVALLAMEC